MKIGLVVEGGGMKCAYGAGILDCFNENHIEFDYGIGVSAGCANLASYQAHQIGRNKRFYTDHIKNPNYCGIRTFLKTGNVFNLNYIYATLTNSDGGDPLDFPAMQANPSEYYLVVTNARTGKPEYFSKETLKQDDYRLIMGSCALPGGCKPIAYNGEYYFDGGVSDSIPAKKAIEDGCDKLVIVLSKPVGYRKEPEKLRFFYKTRCHKFPNTISALDHRHEMYNAQMQYVEELASEGKAFVYAMRENLEISTFSMDPVLEQKLYDMGREEFFDREEELRDFLS